MERRILRNVESLFDLFKHRRYHVDSEVYLQQNILYHVQKIWSLHKQAKLKLNMKPEISFPVAMESGHCYNETLYIWKSELIPPSDKINNLFLFSLHATQSNIYGEWGFFGIKVNSLKSLTIFAKNLHHRYLIGF